MKRRPFSRTANDAPFAIRERPDDMGFAPASILFIDDSPENVRGARSAGLDGRYAASPHETVAILRGLMRDLNHTAGIR